MNPFILAQEFPSNSTMAVMQLISIILAVLGIIVGFVWLIFPFLVGSKLNRLIKLAEDQRTLTEQQNKLLAAQVAASRPTPSDAASSSEQPFDAAKVVDQMLESRKKPERYYKL